MKTGGPWSRSLWTASRFAYDEVRIGCPKCNTPHNFKSRGGNCEKRVYELETCPPAVLSNVNRYSPVKCGFCPCWFAVDEQRRLAIVVDAPAGGTRHANDWYLKPPSRH